MIISLQQAAPRARTLPVSIPEATETHKPTTISDTDYSHSLRGYFSLVRNMLHSWPTTIGTKERTACLALVRFFRLAASGNEWLENLLKGRISEKPNTEALNALTLADELLFNSTHPATETDLKPFANDLMASLMRPQTFCPDKLRAFLDSLRLAS